MKYILSVVLVHISLFAFCQDEFEASVGLKIGYNTTLGTADAVDIDYTRGSGISIGIFRDFKLATRIGLESGIIIDTYKTDYFAPFPVFASSSDNFTYLSIPTIFQFQLASKVNMNLGPQLGFLLSAKSTSDGSEEDVKDLTKGHLINWAVGLEVNTGAGFDIGARYLIGLTDINDAREVLDTSYKLNTIQLYIGIRF